MDERSGAAQTTHSQAQEQHSQDTHTHAGDACGGHGVTTAAQAVLALPPACTAVCPPPPIRTHTQTTRQPPRSPPADAGIQAAGVELVSQGGVQLLVALGTLLELALDVVGALQGGGGSGGGTDRGCTSTVEQSKHREKGPETRMRCMGRVC